MSMLDSFFNKASRTGKCKTLLKLTIPRIKLLRNRREIQVKQMRKDIAKLLGNGQEATARIRVEHIIREENMMAAQEILELFCELVTVRLPIIETQRECPLDLKEAISSICFAAPRCADLPELQQVHMFFAAKYGKEFVTAATELLPDCGVNRQIIELLSVRAPTVEAKLKLLKEIAEEHEVDWDPSATEMEFLMPHEDLLNGPSQFTNGSTLPLPPQKHDTLAPEKVEETHIEPDSDTDSNLLDLPEVPKETVRAAFDVPSAPGNEDLPHVPYTDPTVHDSEQTVTSADNHPRVENKQFIPFVSLPSFPVSMNQNEFAPPLHSSVSDSLKPGHPASSLPPPPSPPSTSQSPKQNEPDFSPSSLSSFPEYVDKIEPATSAKHSESVSPASKDELAASISQTKREISADLQDVLAAAQSAAETAERAAQAARAAANLAQVKISQLASKSSNKTTESCGNNLPGEVSEQPKNLAKPMFHQQYSFGSNDNATAYGQEWKPESLNVASHVPQRLSSLEDDPYFSYPNLFSSKESDPNPVHDSSDKSYD